MYSHGYMLEEKIMPRIYKTKNAKSSVAQLIFYRRTSIDPFLYLLENLLNSFGKHCY